MPKYKTIFFDLDHTLWDYNTNSKDTLLELFDDYKLEQKGVTSFDQFNKMFNTVNEELWSLYDRELITSDVIRQTRFKRILEHFEIFDLSLTEQISRDYLDSCPQKAALVPGAIEVLDYLSEKYSLSIITNGFEEIQAIKLASGKIMHYFDHVITSQQAGCKKPAKEIFSYALGLNNHNSHEAIMIGDNLLTDIAGAKNADVDAVFYNPDKVSHASTITHEISSLKELLQIL